jgi:hypothetical protein
MNSAAIRCCHPSVSLTKLSLLKEGAAACERVDLVLGDLIAYHQDGAGTRLCVMHGKPLLVKESAAEVDRVVRAAAGSLQPVAA